MNLIPSASEGGGTRTHDQRIMIPQETPENVESDARALHVAQQSFQKWAVYMVDSQGRCQNKLCSGKTFNGALAFVAGWSNGTNRIKALVVVPEITL